MPELAHREWEHLFEPWFANEAPHSPTPQPQINGPESLFREASQPLAVGRRDYVRRQSPVNRAIDSRTAYVATEIERLVAYAERRHLGVEPNGADRGEPSPLRDAALRRLAFKAPLPGPAPSTRTQRASRPSD